MKSLFRKGLRDTSYYLLGDVGSKLIRILVLPIITSLLSVAQFGQYDTVLLVSAMVAQFTMLGMDSGFAILISNKENSTRDLSAMFSLSLLTAGILGLLISVIGYFLNLWFEWFSEDLYLLLSVFTLFTVLSQLIFNFLRWNGKVQKASIGGFLGSVLGLFLGLAFIYWLKSTVFNLLLGLTIGTFLSFIIYMIMSYQFMVSPDLHRDRKLFTEYLGKSIHFVPGYLMNYLLKSSDRWLVLSFIGIEALGFYALYSRIAQLGIFVVDLLGKGFIPVMLKNYDLPDGAKLIRKAYDTFVLIILPISIVVYLLAPFVLRIFDKEYHDGGKFLTVLVIANLITAARGLNGFGFIIKSKTYWVSILATISLILNIVISYFLIPDYGIAGVIFGTLAASIVASILNTIVSERYYRFNYAAHRIYIVYGLIFFLSILILRT